MTCRSVAFSPNPSAEIHRRVGCLAVRSPLELKMCQCRWRLTHFCSWRVSQEQSSTLSIWLNRLLLRFLSCTAHLSSTWSCLECHGKAHIYTRSFQLQCLSPNPPVSSQAFAFISSHPWQLLMGSVVWLQLHHEESYASTLQHPESSVHLYKDYGK